MTLGNAAAVHNVRASTAPAPRPTAGGQRPEQLRFRPRQIKPGEPIRPIEHHHLPVVDRRYVGTGLRRQQRERLARAIEHRLPQPGEAEPILAHLGELRLGLRRLPAGELEEVRSRDQAAA
jgi:hypothetical protein